MVLRKTRLEPMAKGNSEMAYSSLIHIGGQNLNEEYCKIFPISSDMDWNMFLNIVISITSILILLGNKKSKLPQLIQNQFNFSII